MKLKRQADELLRKSFLQKNLSLCTSYPFNFEKDETLCVDNQAINKITFKYKHPISRLNNMLDLVFGAKSFFKMILREDNTK